MNQSEERQERTNFSVLRKWLSAPWPQAASPTLPREALLHSLLALSAKDTLPSPLYSVVLSGAS